jgi:hypothetical protein
VRGLRGSAPLWFALTGLCSGLAYLTRPEGALTAVATLAVLVAGRLLSRRGCSWGRTLVCGGTLTAAVLVVAVPFMLIIGHVTLKQSGKRLFERVGGPKAAMIRTPVVSGPPLAWWADDAYTAPVRVRSSRLLSGAAGVGRELLSGFFYVAWIPALIGLYRHRDLFRREPGIWVPALLSITVTLLLYGVAVLSGYASERHLLLVILTGCYFAAAGCFVLGDELARLLTRYWPNGANRWWAQGTVSALLLLTALCTVGGVKSLARLHGDRGGFREAGHWLAEHAEPGDRIEDPYSWASYYAGTVFDEVTPRPRTSNRPAVCYVVIEEAPNNSHSHLPQVPWLRQWARQYGHVVRSWKVPRGTVDIYEVPL